MSNVQDKFLQSLQDAARDDAAALGFFTNCRPDDLEDSDDIDDALIPLVWAIENIQYQWYDFYDIVTPDQLRKEASKLVTDEFAHVFRRADSNNLDVAE